ncbi:MAG: hypothetical protein ACJ789_08750 [Thermomicrobiales bacterium]
MSNTITVSFNSRLTAPCLDELVTISGDSVITTITTIDAQGGLHEQFHPLPRNVRGEGLTSGSTFLEVGGARARMPAR